jgi:hypothetical protein
MSPANQPPDIPERHRNRHLTTVINTFDRVPDYAPPPSRILTPVPPGSQPSQEQLAPHRQSLDIAVEVPREAQTASYVPDGRVVLPGRQMTPPGGVESAQRTWDRMSLAERVILGLAMFLLTGTVVTMITVFRTAGKGHAAVSKRILLCGMLIIVASSAAAMFAIQKNVGEVLLTMTMLLVLGIFLNSFQDVIYGS